MRKETGHEAHVRLPQTPTLVDEPVYSHASRVISLVGSSSLLANTTSDYGVGENDFSISDMGIDSELDGEAVDPVIAYNSQDHEYLVVWLGSNSPDDIGGIYGQRLDATGTEIGADDFRIDDPADEDDYLVGQADVTYNPTANEYLVAWGSAKPAGLIWQTLDSEGQPVARSDAAISDTSPFSFDSFEVAYHAVANEYMLVWSAESGNDLNVYGQRLDSTTGEEVGTNDFLIGTLVDGLGRAAPQPAVTYNDTTQEYLVVWSGAPDELGDTQIHGQQLSATGQEVGADDFVLSQHGSADETNIARSPDVVYNPTDNQYLVT